MKIININPILKILYSFKKTGYNIFNINKKKKDSDDFTKIIKKKMNSGN